MDTDGNTTRKLVAIDHIQILGDVTDYSNLTQPYLHSNDNESILTSLNSVKDSKIEPDFFVNLIIGTKEIFNKIIEKIPVSWGYNMKCAEKLSGILVDDEWIKATIIRYQSLI